MLYVLEDVCVYGWITRKPPSQFHGPLRPLFSDKGEDSRSA